MCYNLCRIGEGMRFSRGKIIVILLLMSVSVGLLVYSFAWTTINQTEGKVNYLKVSDIKFGLNDSMSSVNLGEVAPTIDKFGLLNAPFTFSISNDDTKSQEYTVRLVDGDVKSSISNNNIRYQLTIDGKSGDVKTLDENGVIDSGTLNSSSVREYSLKVWLSYDSEALMGTWNKIIKVDAGKINLDKSGANEPTLKDNMIPVYYDYKDENWKIADSKNTDINYKWYDYTNREWANVVTVTDKSRANYLNAKLGTTVKNEDILAFFVWIPRYKYTLFDSEKTNLVDIKFERGIDSTGTMKCFYKNGSESCVDNTYGKVTVGKTTYTHPAFTFNNEELTGIWISKFELSTNDNKCSSSNNTANCNKDSLNILSIPNKTPLNYINIANMFRNIRSMELYGNIHGFVNTESKLKADGLIENDSNDIDIHMIKSYEMGSIIYLTYSSYGKLSNEKYSKDNRDVFSKATVNVTGMTNYQGKNYVYNVPNIGEGSSSTGNVYGIYDLNSMSSSFVMGNVLKNNKFNSKLFKNALDNRYYDAYDYRDKTNKASHYGDGIGEFYGISKNIYMPYATSPFIERLGILSSNYSDGLDSVYKTSRATIVVKQDIYITEW